MTTPARPDLSPTRGHLALGALALGAFGIGTAELVVVGILNVISKDLSISVSAAGQVITAYALGISIGAPILTALTTRFGRRFLLWLSLAVFVAGNVVAALAVSFGMLLVARVVTGSIHGLFIGVASVVAAALVPEERRGVAMSMVFGGLAVATVLGAPLGTLIGQALGWQASFVGIVVLGALALAATLAFVPAVPGRGVGGFAAQARAALAPRVLSVLGVTILVMAGQFVAFTYLAPYLEEVTGVSGQAVSIFLLAFGVATAVGTFLGGKAADRNVTMTLVVANALLVVALVILIIAGSAPVPAALAMAVWGLAGFAFIPAMQLRTVTLAGGGGDLAASLGASAFNIGIAAGSIIGGWVVAGQGVDATVVVAAVLCAVALPATYASKWARVPEPAAAGGDAGKPAARRDDARSGSRRAMPNPG
jgi:DHA1 family inner membrane transport protein